jgi:hypothetical protein
MTTIYCNCKFCKTLKHRKLDIFGNLKKYPICYYSTKQALYIIFRYIKIGHNIEDICNIGLKLAIKDDNKQAFDIFIECKNIIFHKNFPILLTLGKPYYIMALENRGIKLTHRDYDDLLCLYLKTDYLYDIRFYLDRGLKITPSQICEMLDKPDIIDILRFAGYEYQKNSYYILYILFHSDRFNTMIYYLNNVNCQQDFINIYRDLTSYENNKKKEIKSILEEVYYKRYQLPYAKRNYFMGKLPNTCYSQYDLKFHYLFNFKKDFDNYFTKNYEGLYNCIKILHDKLDVYYYHKKRTYYDLQKIIGSDVSRYLLDNYI